MAGIADWSELVKNVIRNNVQYIFRRDVEITEGMLIKKKLSGNFSKTFPFAGRDAHRHPHTHAGSFVFHISIFFFYISIFFSWFGYERFVSGRGECVRVKLKERHLNMFLFVISDKPGLVLL